jgi:hypothetical protein
MKRSALLALVAVLFLSALPAAAQTWQWAQRIAGACYDYYAYPYRVATDNAGNVYVTGYFYYYITIGGVTYYAYNYGANVDMFVVKYNASGQVQWVRTGGGTSSEYGYGIAVDANGNVYVAGYYYSNPAYFGSWSLATASTPDVFVVKYDANGNVQWAARMAGTSTDILYNLAADGAGNVYLTGYFSTSTVFYSAGATTGTTLSAVGSGVEAFVAKYNTNGVFQWARAIGGSSSEYGYGVGVDQNGNVYVAGYYYSNPLYIGSTAMSLSMPYATPEVFLASFDANGNARWAAHGLVGTSTEILYDMSTDANGNCYLTGYFSSNPAYAISAGGSSSVTLYPASTTPDVYAVKFNSSGVVQWARAAGGTSSEYGYGIDADNSGNVYVGGYHYGAFTFGSSTISVSTTPDVFILVWKSDGTPDFGVAATGNSSDITYHLRVSRPRREAVMTGYFYSYPLTFGSIQLYNDNYYCNGYAAGFVAKMKVAPNFDAGIVGLANPQPPFASGNQGITVRLQNFGRQALTSVTINWSLNGVPQTPYSWSGTLNPQAVTTVTLGTVNFQPKTIVTLSVSTASPNGQTDEDPSNDGITAQLAPALAGAYTIGGASPDFPSFTSAANYLHIGGVLDTVTFRVRDGVYTEQLNLNGPTVTGGIPGAGTPTRRITFESESGNRANVILQWASSSSADNFVVRLNELKHVVLRNLTIRNTGASFGRVVWLTSTSTSFGNGSDNVTIEGCELVGRQAATTATADAVVYAYENNHNNLVIRNSILRNGSVGVFIASYWAPLTTGFRLEGSTVQDFYVGAVYAFYQASPTVVGNRFIGGAGSIASGGYYVRFANCDDAITVERNQMWGMPGGSGVLLQSFYSSTAATARVVNNFIEIGGNTANLARGIDVQSRPSIAIVHNSVNVRSSNASGAAFYVSGGSSLRVTHNIFINSGAGYAVWASGAFATTCNWNNLYTAGANLGYWAGANRPTLAAWRTASGYDGASISKPVPWASPTDLHLTEVDDPLYTGVPQNTDVPTDIDGEARRVWYMGADEVIPVITIVQQPTDTVRGCLGSSTTLSIQATATFNARLSYQWLRNGAPIPEGYDGRFFGTETPTLAIQNTKPTDAGSYACLVTGNSGATPVLSNLAEVIVYAPIEITQQPESQLSCLGGEVILMVIADGTVFGYQWQVETPAGWQDIPGATQASLRLSNLQYASSGRYRCVLFGTCGTDQLPTEPAAVYVLGNVNIVAPPDTVYTAVGGRAQLSVQANVVGAPPTYQAQYQWYRGTQPLVDGGRISGARSSVLVIDGVQPQDFGTDYWVEVVGLCGRAEQRGYAVVSAGVEIVEQPQGGEWCVGSDVVLSVQAQATAGQLAYQWRRNGQPLVDGGRISGARTAQLRIGSVQPGDAGTYDVVVSLVGAGVDVVSQGAQVEVREAVQVVQQPQGGSVCEGEALALEVGATGGGLQYQWYKDGQPIAGATQARYEVAAARLQDAGTYWCVVRNMCGQEQTVQVEVSVVEAPRIVQDVPQAVQVQQGQPLVLEIQASGAGLQYQWYKDGQPIAGATQARYEVAAAQQQDTGTYWCVVRGTCGQVESGRVTVSVVVSVAGDAGEREWVEVVPQPVAGVGQVRYGVMGRGEVVVRDVLGREVSRVRVEGRGEVGIGFGGAGVYVVQLEREGRVVGQQVVVVVR